MNRSENISFNKVFTEQNSILVVIAFPRHISNDNIMTESKFTVISRRSISQYLTFDYSFTFSDNRSLVYTSSLIRTFEFQKFININALRALNTNFVSSNANNCTCIFGKNTYAGIDGNFVFHTSSNNRRLCAKKRYRLTLHVRTHQGTVSIIVFQERNQRSCNRNNLFW